MPGSKLFDAAQYAAMVGHIAEGEIVIDCGKIDFTPQGRMGRERFELRPEQDAAIRNGRVKEWLYSKPIPGEKQLFGAGIIYGEDKHAVEMLYTCRPPMAPAMQDNFAVALGGEAITSSFQFSAQFPEVVYFPIEGERQCAVIRMHGLRTALQIDDRQPPMA